MKSQVDFKISNRAQKILSDSHFSVDQTEAMAFIEEKKPGSFNFTFEHTKLDGPVQFLGIVDPNDLERPLLALKYSCNFQGPKRAFLEGAVRLLQNRKALVITKLSVREVENYLRDNNDTPAFDVPTAVFYPVLEFLTSLQKKMQENGGSRGGGVKQSPVIGQDYKFESAKLYDVKSAGPYTELAREKQFAIVQLIFDRIIRPALLVDQGDAEVVFVDGAMVVILFQGQCAHCSFSLTSTIDFIQKVLQIELFDSKMRVMTDN